MRNIISHHVSQRAHLMVIISTHNPLLNFFTKLCDVKSTSISQKGPYGKTALQRTLMKQR